MLLRRSGGKTGLTFLFDFGFTWILVIPLGYVLSYHTSLDIHILFAVLNLIEIVKVIIGFFMIRSDIWMNNIVDDMTEKEVYE